MANLVEISHGYEPEGAYCTKAFLTAYGFHVVIQNEHHLAVNPALRVALGGYRLLIPKSEAEEAQDLLRSVNVGEISADDSDQPVCLECGYIGLQRKRSWIWFLIALAQGIPFVPYRNKLTCSDCGATQQR